VFPVNKIITGYRIEGGVWPNIAISVLLFPVIEDSLPVK
jgi:hypothetical protein